MNKNSRPSEYPFCNKPAAVVRLAMIPFERQEFAGRVAKTKETMVKRGLDVLIVSSPENINYLTGYAGWSFYTPQVAVLSLNQDEPFLLLRSMDVPCAEFTTYLGSEQVVGYPESLIGNQDSHPCLFMGQWIGSRGWGNQRIGVEGDSHFFSVHAFEAIRTALPDAKFADASLLVNWLRTVKSEQEIDYMKQAGEIASLAMEAAVAAIKPNRRQCDVVAKIYAAQIGGTSDYGGSVPFAPVISAGTNTRAPHLSWTDGRFSSGQTVTIELGASRFQYHCGIARALHLGRPPASLVKLSRVVADSQQEALESIRPGVECQRIEQSWRRAIAKEGLRKEARIGYSIGLGFQPIWIEGTASLQAGDQTVIKENMTFHMICAMLTGGDNFVISETVQVTGTGFEKLTNFPSNLLA